MSNNKSIGIVCLIVFTIMSIVISLNIRNKIEDKKNTIESLPDIEELTFIKEVLPSEINEYKKNVEESIDLFLTGANGLEGKVSKKGNVFLSKLFVQSGKPSVVESTNEDVRSEYYKGFSYTLNNIGVRSTKTNFSEFEMIADLTVRYNDKDVYTTLISIDLSQEQEIIGGAFYGGA